MPRYRVSVNGWNYEGSHKMPSSAALAAVRKYEQAPVQTYYGPQEAAREYSELCIVVQRIAPDECPTTKPRADLTGPERARRRASIVPHPRSGL